MKLIVCFVFFILVLSPVIHAAEVYRYQDEKGRWHFTDKKPVQDADTLQVSNKAAQKKETVRLEVRSMPGYWSLVAHNPLPASVQIVLNLKGERQTPLSQVLAPYSETILANNVNPRQQYHFQVFWGDPSSKPQAVDYYLPVKRNVEHFISQGFSGQFSHQQESALYAVDIALPVGTEIMAARAGIVADVEDGFVMDGTNSYFADKANNIKILHDDGTLAVYAHLLAGGAKVALGQAVKAGDVIGLSGSTGFSTGPHLHFVVWRNAYQRIVSVPFRFKEFERQVEPWLPQTGMLLEPN